MPVSRFPSSGDAGNGSGEEVARKWKTEVLLNFNLSATILPYIRFTGLSID